ncbi:hypothetical protein PINS_up022528 [Pythium insidiosum]|nr:hypothetical protein PINS_up018219 [Pythium insidiosum]GLE10427.1 hypothetical protein PINS_up022528 [Pythium insidiosum]
MKTAAIAIAAVATVAMTHPMSVAAYNYSDCPTSEILRLRPLISEPSRVPCEQFSGFTFIPPKGAPTDEQRALMCLSDDCKKTVDAILALKPSDCQLVWGDARLHVKELAETFEPRCKANGPLSA